MSACVRPTVLMAGHRWSWVCHSRHICIVACGCVLVLFWRRNGQVMAQICTEYRRTARSYGLLDMATTRRGGPQSGTRAESIPSPGVAAAAALQFRRDLSHDVQLGPPGDTSRGDHRACGCVRGLKGLRPPRPCLAVAEASAPPLDHSGMPSAPTGGFARTRNPPVRAIRRRGRQGTLCDLARCAH